MTMPTDLVFHSIASSNIPRQEKSGLLKLVDSLTRGSISRYEEKNVAGTVVHKGHLHSLMSVARQDGEAFLFGGMMGAIDQETGSDKTPVIAAGLGAIVAVLSSGTWMETSARNLSATGTGIWAYQAGKNFMKEKRLAAGGGSVAGEAGEDPIIAMGKTL